MLVVADDILQFRPRQVRLVFGEVKFGQLHLGARVGMVLRDVLPVLERIVGFAEGGERFGQRHHRVAVIVVGFLVHDAFEKRPRLNRAIQADEALAKMRAGVNVGGIALERGAVTFFRLGKISALEINVAEQEMVVGVVEVMDLRLKFLDAFAAPRAGQFETARGGRRGGAINKEEIKQRCDAPADEDENRPQPFAVADGVDEHPDLERKDNQPNRAGQKVLPVLNIVEQRGHGVIFNAKTQRRKVKGARAARLRVPKKSKTRGRAAHAPAGHLFLCAFAPLR